MLKTCSKIQSFLKKIEVEREKAEVEFINQRRIGGLNRSSEKLAAFKSRHLREEKYIFYNKCKKRETSTNNPKWRIPII